MAELFKVGRLFKLGFNSDLLDMKTLLEQQNVQPWSPVHTEGTTLILVETCQDPSENSEQNIVVPFGHDSTGL